MSKANDSVFDEYEDLYKLTSKTADDNIEFYDTKESLSEADLFAIWAKLSKQATNFDNRDWTKKWYNWHKNYQAFEKHRLEAKFLIQHYLADVLAELVGRLIKKCEHFARIAEENKKQPRELDADLSSLVRKEVKKLVKEELEKRKTKKKS